MQNTRSAVMHTYKREHWARVEKHLQNEHVGDFLRRCASLAFKMHLQTPAMRFHDERKGEFWNDQSDVILTYESDPYRPHAAIRFYRYPALYHEDRCVAKGMVHVS